MTGYGEAERETAAGTLRVEVRTVNHRHLNVNFRLPNALARWEGELREWLRAHFARGHVNCSVRLEPPAGSAAARGLRIDEERVQAYLALFRDMGTRLGVAGEPDLALITRFNDVIVRDEGEAEQVEVTPEELRAALDDAARQNLGMREDEGRRLHDDLEGRLRAIDAIHLATGMEARRNVPSGVSFRFASADRRLNAAAVSELFDVFDPRSPIPPGASTPVVPGG